MARENALKARFACGLNGNEKLISFPVFELLDRSSIN
jgi:hypothetical protein